MCENNENVSLCYSAGPFLPSGRSAGCIGLFLSGSGLRAHASFRLEIPLPGSLTIDIFACVVQDIYCCPVCSTEQLEATEMWTNNGELIRGNIKQRRRMQCVYSD